MAYKDHYGFGKNWERFLDRYYSDVRLDAAKESLKDFLATENLEGRRFLDIGCGSGLFSYAAYELGASPVTSFDVDTFSVRCCEALRERAGSPHDWNVCEGSVLDDDFTAGLPKADVVYSWGVLHHTGRMWEAVEKAASRLAPRGLFYIALYGPMPGRVNSEGWLTIKKLYNRLPRVGQFMMEWSYVGIWVVFKALRGGHPLRTIREYPAVGRGMSFRTDVSDWLGGYPYEWASAEEVVAYCKEQLGLESLKAHVKSDGGCNEFLFRRR